MSSLWALAVAVGAVALAPRPAAADPIAADKLPEPALAVPPGADGAYMRKVHALVHKRWADNFLRLASEQLPANNPVNQADRSAVVDLILSDDGRIISINLIQSGGFLGFDDAITEVLRDVVPFPPAPVSARSDDDAVHLRWRFARDQRRCSEVVLLHVEDPLAQAVPKLLRDGRQTEVLRRMHVARDGGGAVEPMMSTVASHWLRATINAPYATARAAETLVAMGDRAGVRWLELGVKRAEWAEEAGQALAAHHVAVCPLVGFAFDPVNRNMNLTEQQQAATALSTAAEPDCVPGLIRLLENPKARPEARAAAARALGPMLDPAAAASRPAADLAKKALAAASKDESATVRAAALLAAVRPGAGRGKVYSLVPFLRDPSPEVRAAAAAGVVRAGGDANLDDLYVVFKDSDARPAEAVAVELDRLQTEESTKFLVRLLKRPQLSVQLLAARALMKRGARDWFAALRPMLDKKYDPELRNIALVSADEATLDDLARSLEQAVAADVAGDGAKNDTAKGDPAQKATAQKAEADEARTARTALALYRARLARGERTPAADLFIATGARLAPSDQADAMADWLKTRGPTAPSAAAGSPPRPQTPPEPATSPATPPATAGRASRKR
jgi:HEAT repeat protein